MTAMDSTQTLDREPLAVEHAEIGGSTLTPMEMISLGTCEACDQYHGSWEPCPPAATASALAHALSALRAITLAGYQLAAATRAEIALEDGRAAEKSAAILRLMGVVNPETTRLHSGSSAEKVVETDPAYASYRARQSAAVVARITAGARYEAALLRAKLSVRLVPRPRPSVPLAGEG